MAASSGRVDRSSFELAGLQVVLQGSMPAAFTSGLAFRYLSVLKLADGSLCSIQPKVS